MSLPPFASVHAAVTFVGAGPGSAAHLTLAAYAALQSAEVVIHDRLVGAEVLALIPQGVRLVDAGKEGFGAAVPQAEITATILAHAATGARVVRLKGGDCGIFGRLDEEMDAVAAAGHTFRIIPGVTAASAAAASIGQSLTKRGRNGSLRIITGHDMQGFAEQDWRGLARAGEVAAIYMGKRSARFIQGRLLMHGAVGDTPVTIVENVSRGDERVIPATLSTLPQSLEGVDGPVVLLYGLAPRQASQALPLMNEVRA